jgi:hypothetical protein
MNRRLRPITSLIRPKNGTRPVRANVYIMRVHSTSESEAFSSPAILGKAILSIEMSTTTMNKPKATEKRISHGLYSLFRFMLLFCPGENRDILALSLAVISSEHEPRG